MGYEGNERETGGEGERKGNGLVFGGQMGLTGGFGHQRVIWFQVGTPHRQNRVPKPHVIWFQVVVPRKQNRVPKPL